MNKIFLNIILVLPTFGALGSLAEPLKQPQIIINGQQTAAASIDFAEAIYLAANLLDPNCLLRFPDGSYAPASEAITAEPEIGIGGDFALTLPITPYLYGPNPCQLQLALIKIWLKDKHIPSDAESFVALLLEGSRAGAEELSPFEDAESIKCGAIDEVLRCTFTTPQKDTNIVTIPKNGAEKTKLIISN